MRFIFSILAAAAGIYSTLILIRVIISWFGSFAGSKPVEILARITDPYLDWWRRNLNLRVGFIDFSAVAGIVFLSLVQRILYSVSYYQRISVGIILALLLQYAWNIAAFILGFFIIVLILRLIAYLANLNIYGSFWRAVDSVSQPLLYRLNRMFFGSRIAGYLKGIILSILFLTAIWIAGGFAVRLLAGLLVRLPV